MFFEKLPHPHSMSRFLHGSVSTSARYCPQCLAEEPFFRLPWRFTRLNVCPHHHCWLLNQCQSCGAEIPFISQNFQIGICESCHETLGDKTAAAITDLKVIEEESLTYQSIIKILTFSGDASLEMHRKSMGRKLLEARISHSYSISQLARLVKTDAWQIRYNETAIDKPYCGYLEVILKTAEILELSMEIFLDINPDEANPPVSTADDKGPIVDVVETRKKIKHTSSTKWNHILRKELPEKIYKAIEVLKENDQRITRANVRRILGVSFINSINNPDVIKAIQTIKEERTKQYKRKRMLIAEKANKLSNEIKENGDIPKYDRICEEMGISRTCLRDTLRKEHLKSVSRHRDHYEEIAKDPLLAINQAMSKLETQNIPISQSSIAQTLKVSAAFLLRQPKVRELFNELGLIRNKKRNSPQSNIYFNDYK